MPFNGTATINVAMDETKIDLIQTQTDKIPAEVVKTAAIKTETDKIAATIVKVDAEVIKTAAIKVETDKIPATITKVDTISTAVVTTIPGEIAAIDTLIDGAITKIDTIDGIVDDIKAALATGIVTGNIKAGVTILGVAGKTEVVDTQDSNAVAGDIALGKTAYVNGVKITGTFEA